MKQTILSFFCCCFLLPAFTQDITVRGLISSAETGEPLQGVEIELQGTPRKTTSTAQGFFEINVPPPNIFYARKNEILAMDRLICVQVDQQIDLQGKGELLICIFSSEIIFQSLHAFQVQYL